MNIEKSSLLITIFKDTVYMDYTLVNTLLQTFKSLICNTLKWQCEDKSGVFKRGMDKEYSHNKYITQKTTRGPFKSNGTI